MERRFALLRHDHRNDATSGYTPGERNGSFGSGSYTPTLTNVLNVASASPTNWMWLRVGKVVHVWGRVDIDPTATGATQLKATLPITSLTGHKAAGSGYSSSTAQGLAVVPNSDYVEFQYVASSAASADFFFSFSYEIQA